MNSMEFHSYDSLLQQQFLLYYGLNLSFPKTFLGLVFEHGWAWDEENWDYKICKEKGREGWFFSLYKPDSNVIWHYKHNTGSNEGKFDNKWIQEGSCTLNGIPL